MVVFCTVPSSGGPAQCDRATSIPFRPAPAIGPPPRHGIAPPGTLLPSPPPLRAYPHPPLPLPLLCTSSLPGPPTHPTLPPSPRLLLQQRASSKVTFPSVWTNTCCSHQLYGQAPDEVDTQEAILDGSVPGARAAALRKLDHELGIRQGALRASELKFLTRLHYCAPDAPAGSGGVNGGNGSSSSNGNGSSSNGNGASGREQQQAGPGASGGGGGPRGDDGGVWGEHEVDYILLARRDVDLDPNPEEVDAVRWVTQAELEAMMDPSSGLRWSPWFRIIAQRFLPAWWGDLDGALRVPSPKHDDFGTVHHIL